MEYLIDRKFWNKVLKKISVPDLILKMKEKFICQIIGLSYPQHIQKYSMMK